MATQAKMHNVFFIYYCIILTNQIQTSTSLQSLPNNTNPSSINKKNQLHPTGRRWKRRRKQQTFVSSPHREVTPFEEVALLQQLGYVPPNICCVSSCSGDYEDHTTTVVTNNRKEEMDTSPNGTGRPIAIKSYPLLIQQTNSDDKYSSMDQLYNNCHVTPFPTMYWLSDVHISRAISELERLGFVREFQSRLEMDDGFANEWYQCHKEYAMERWELLSIPDREWLLRDGLEDEKEQKTISSMRDMIQHSGVAGTDYKGEMQDRDGRQPPPHGSLFVPSVKCLHSHYAHYRSQLCRNNQRKNDECASWNVVGKWTHDLLLEKFPELRL
jgi:hypothetical protein